VLWLKQKIKEFTKRKPISMPTISQNLQGLTDTLLTKASEDSTFHVGWVGKSLWKGCRKIFAARLGRALQGHGNYPPKAVSESSFIVTIVAARADKLSLWSFM
jgi:hypothetical protein